MSPSSEGFRGEKTPFSLKSVRAVSKGLILTSPQIKDRTAAEKLINQFVYVNAEVFASQPGERIFLREILGFEVFDKGLCIGPITSFSSNGPQDLLIVQTQSLKVEIPFVDAFVQEIKFSEKQIHMRLPEGLLELTADASKDDPS